MTHARFESLLTTTVVTSIDKSNWNQAQSGGKASASTKFLGKLAENAETGKGNLYVYY